MKTPLKILFLCTANSCRSILGEALANHLGEGRLIARSAGSHPSGRVHPRALAVLERHGVPVGQPVSKSMDDLDDEWFDVVITVCDAAAGEACPVWLAESAKVHWGIPDPAAAEGDDPAIEAAFEATYQRLRGRLEKLVALDLESMTPPGLTASLQKIHREAGEH
ncbi:MAG: low molecular weight phosphatase family protein [Alcanivorax sp.]|nr:low molecular weight phosphatase family protein [Alcanivorax sp.]MAY10519.1 low molecular weight phosphatase family protein [Alcanivorax sp.]MBI52948.1 low molecular weight phosphatase family protein [Alcanivorax sp.]HCE40587.1 low molecular weight phosphatase family protein [Alcanivorax sp.]